MKEKLLIPQDKANHLIYGLLIFLVLNLFLTDYQSLFLTYVIAFISEMRDRLRTGIFSLLDLTCSIILPIIIIIFQQWM